MNYFKEIKVFFEDKISCFIAWIKTDSSTKATWFAGIFTALMFVVNTYVVYQNSIALDLSRKTLELTLEPSIEFQLYPGANYIINTSKQTLKEISLYPITYVFDPTGIEVIERIQPMVPGFAKEALRPQERMKLGLAALAPLTEGGYSIENNNVFRSLVVTFRREQDNRLYKAIHIYRILGIDKVKNNVAIVSLGSGHKSGSWSGPPQKYMKIINKIEEIEKVMFNTERFK